MSDQVLATGVDARSFLQGQLSQDMATVDRDGSAWSWLLQPTGKVAALVLVTRVADETYSLAVDHGFGAVVLARLQRFRLRVKVTLELTEAAGFAFVGDDAARIEAGWPAMGRELTPDETIPNAAGINDRTVSFTKGCYTGQELVARVDSRGDHTPQRLHRLDALNGMLVEGDLVDDDGKVVGSVTTTAGAAGLGWVARSVDLAAILHVGGQPVRIRASDSTSR